MLSKLRVNWRWIITILICCWAVAVAAGQGLTHLTPGSPLFIINWCLKVLASSLTIAIPISIGASQHPSKNQGWTIVLLWIVGLLTTTVAKFTTQPVMASNIVSPELYVTQNIYISWIGASLLWLFHDQLQSLLHHWQLKTRRLATVIILTIFCLANWLFHYDLFGFNQGTSFIWLLLLFAIGDCLANDQQFKNWLRKPWQKFLTIVVWLAAFLASWLTMNHIQYSPHDGFTPNFHYLYGISSYQPILLLAVILSWSWLHEQDLKQADKSKAMGILLLNLLALPAMLTPWLKLHFSWGKIAIATLVLAVLLWLVSYLVGLAESRLPVLHWQTWPWRKWGRALLKAWPILATYLACWLMTVASFYWLWPSRQWTMIQWMITQRGPIVRANVLIIFAIILILAAITNRWWMASGIGLIAYAGWLIASFLKIAARNEPILPSDLAALSAPKELLGMVSPGVLWGSIAAFIIALVIFIGIDHRWPAASWRPSLRIAVGIVALAYLLSFNLANHSSSISYKYLQSIDDTPYFYSQLRGSRVNGTLLQFANNIDVRAMIKPDGYSKAKMKSIAKKYQAQAKQINYSRKHQDTSSQSLVFVLSESYSDPRRVPGLHISGGNPMKYYDQLAKKTTSGLMLSSGYGGGTANMEYQALTGFSIALFSPTMPTPYSQLVPYQSRPFAISNFFNYSIGIHPFTANLYSRKKVYAKFGFKKFYHFDGGNKLTYTSKIQHNPRVSDKAAYQETLLHLKQPGNKFIQLATMQNHMPYNTDYYRHLQYKVRANWIKSDQTKSEIEAYCQGIHYTDLALKNWIKQLDALDKPVTVVWYGDHLPGIYHGLSMGKYGIQLHETNYFIYQNPAAKKLDAGTKSIPHKLVSPNFFPALAFNEMNVKVSPYLALVTRMAEEMPAMTVPTNGTSKNNSAHQGGTEFINEHGKQVSLTRKQKALLHDYRLVQYDLTDGHGYLHQAKFLTKLP